jgi:hypothetical protein
VGENDKSQILFFEVYGSSLTDLIINLQGKEILDFEILENQIFILNNNDEVEIYDADGVQQNPINQKFVNSWNLPGAFEPVKL